MIFFATKSGIVMLSKVDAYRCMQTTRSKGVKGLTLKKNDAIVSALVVDNLDQTILTITENGYAKKTKASAYRVYSNRGGVGVNNVNKSKTSSTGFVVKAIIVDEEQDLLITSKEGKSIRTKTVEINLSGRCTMGVKIFTLSNEDQIVSIDAIDAKTEDSEI